MILDKCPIPDMLIAFVKSANTVSLPIFSDVKIENGQVTLQVELKPKSYEPEDYFAHMDDTQQRYLENKPAFPFKFEYFDVAQSGPKFRITADELFSWKEIVRKEGSATRVSFNLFQELRAASNAVAYYTKRHRKEVQETMAPRLANNNWRYDS